MRRLPPFRVAAVGLLAACLASAPACRKPPKSAAAAKAPQPELQEWLKRNRLAATPSGFLQRQAQAPVHWQPWTKETVAAASEANRLIFLFVGSPVYASSDAALAAIHSSPQTVAALNEGTSIPILADAEANRELGRLTALLSAEIRRPVAFPFLVWLSPQGNPIAWIPVDLKNQNRFLALLDQSNSMVFRMWNDSPEYVTGNSARDADLRRQRLKGQPPTKPAPAALDRLTAATRTLCDLYNEDTKEIDGSGGLFPCASVEFLASAALSKALPESIRTSAASVTGNFVQAILASPMIDPLDGGIFSARRGTGWNLPNFSRDTATQARACVALLAAWNLDHNPRTLKVALDALRFADSGLGSRKAAIVHSVPCPEDRQSSFLWTLEDLKKVLEPAEFTALASAMDLQGLGNIPSENDTERRHFRLNTLGRQPAASAVPPPDNTAQLLDSACRKLHKARAENLANLPVETTIYARNLARLASAHAAAFAATGDPAHLKQATEHLQTLRRKYQTANQGLRQTTADADPCFTTARALDYALAIHAAIDLHNVTLDPSWITWADGLLDFASQNFIVDGRLMECEPAIAPVDFAVSDYPMLFEESSVGLFAGALSRMSAYHRSQPPAMLEMVNRQLSDGNTNPIIRADLLATEAARQLHPLVQIPGDQNTIATFLPAIQRVHPRLVTVVILPANDSARQVSLTLPGREGTTSHPASPDELLQSLCHRTTGGS